MTDQIDGHNGAAGDPTTVFTNLMAHFQSLQQQQPLNQDNLTQMFNSYLQMNGSFQPGYFNNTVSNQPQAPIPQSSQQFAATQQQQQPTQYNQQQQQYFIQQQQYQQPAQYNQVQPAISQVQQPQQLPQMQQIKQAPSQPPQQQQQQIAAAQQQPPQQPIQPVVQQQQIQQQMQQIHQMHQQQQQMNASFTNATANVENSAQFSNGAPRYSVTAASIPMTTAVASAALLPSASSYLARLEELFYK